MCLNVRKVAETCENVAHKCRKSSKKRLRLFREFRDTRSDLTSNSHALVRRMASALLCITVHHCCRNFFCATRSLQGLRPLEPREFLSRLLELF